MKYVIFAAIFITFTVAAFNQHTSDVAGSSTAAVVNTKEETQEQLNKRLDKIIGFAPIGSSKARKSTSVENEKIANIVKEW